MQKSTKRFRRWAGILPVVFLFFPILPARAIDLNEVGAQYTYAAQTLLTRAIGASDILKWTVRNVFDNTVTFNKSITQLGRSYFYNPVIVDNGMRAKNLTVEGDTIIGDTSLDDMRFSGKIARPGGPIWIYDDLRVEGDLELRTATIGSGEIQDGAITSTDLEKAYQGTYEKTVVVGPVGTTTQNGTALLNAVAGITDASSSNRYLIKIEPGAYDLGSDTLVMKDYIDIEGSGQGITRVISDTAGTNLTGVITAVDNTELRHLTVEVDGSGTEDVGIVIKNTESPYIRNVTVEVNSSGNTGVGIYAWANNGLIEDVKVDMIGTASNMRGIYTRSLLNGKGTVINRAYITGDANEQKQGIYAYVTDPIITDTVIDLENHGLRGIFLNSSSGTFTNLTIDVTNTTNAASAIETLGTSPGTTQIDHSIIKGKTNAINSTVAQTFLIGASQLDGGISNGGGATLTCVDSYNENYAAVNASCL